MKAAALLCLATWAAAPALPRPRIRDLGVSVGVLPTGQLNAITDVPGVLVGQVTVIEGDAVRTGVTAVLPRPARVFQDKVTAAVHVGNGFGKLMGSTQVDELGEIETPIVLTSTLNVPRVADAVLDFMLSLPENRDVQSMNPIVAETNDGYLNDVRGRHVTRAHVLEALAHAKTGPVEEGSVGAGTGTVAFGWKGGIGTASRRLPASAGGHTVGVLVQTNFGGVLQMLGVPVGEALGRYYMRQARGMPERATTADGSVIVVVATDAPLDAAGARRVASRAMLGLGRTGGIASHGSGEYVIAFSTAPRAKRDAGTPRETGFVQDAAAGEGLSPLFLATIEATEEAVYNSLLRATNVTGRGHTVEALPVERVKELLRPHQANRPSP